MRSLLTGVGIASLSIKKMGAGDIGGRRRCAEMVTPRTNQFQQPPLHFAGVQRDARESTRKHGTVYLSYFTRSPLHLHFLGLLMHMVKRCLSCGHKTSSSIAMFVLRVWRIPQQPKLDEYRNTRIRATMRMSSWYSRSLRGILWGEFLREGNQGRGGEKYLKKEKKCHS